MNGKMVGDILREARVNQKLQLSDIEKSTGIAMQHLLALELDQFSLIPEENRTHYLVSYADVVGLNKDEIQEEYDKQVNFQNTLPHFSLSESAVPVNEKKMEETFERTPHRRRRSHREETQKKSIWPVTILSLLSLAIIILVSYFVIKAWPFTTSSQNQSSSEVTTNAETTTVSEITTVTETPISVKPEVQTDGSYLATVSTSQETVNFTFTLTGSESWVAVNDGIYGEQGTMLNASQTEYTVTLSKGTSTFITLGVPSAVTVTVEGQEIDLTDFVNSNPAFFTLNIE